jgi:BlaI family transcriptional regulator, penicillinase repressor
VLAKPFATLRRAKGFANFGPGGYLEGHVMRELGSSQPTAVELEILRVLWELGPSPVRAIHAPLAEAKGTNYSTTVKMLSVMLIKGLVKRDERATPHIYRAAMTRDRAARKLLSELIEKVYDGSAMSLVLQALASGKASKTEIEEARKLLDELEDKS